MSYSVSNSYIPSKQGVEVEHPWIQMNLAQPKTLGPLIYSSRYFPDTKDPCPVFDGKVWHLYGSGGNSENQSWKILHAVAPSIFGPWQEQLPATLPEVKGPHTAAPGLLYDNQQKLFHMFIQTDCFGLGGNIEHRISTDGHTFILKDIALESIPNSSEAGIYDPHPAEIKGQKYLIYSGFPEVAHGDLYLAKSLSNTWDGPWERMGKILSHEQLSHHNQHDHPDYEWGLEGAQLLELPNGQILLNAVCFLPNEKKGQKQRIFFAIADQVLGPYHTLGPVLQPEPGNWDGGENGHGTALLLDQRLYLFYQARSPQTQNLWRYGLAIWNLI